VRRRYGYPLIFFGVALLLVAGTVIWRSRPAPSVGSVPAAVVTPGPTPGAAAVEVPPTRLAIPDLGLTARIVPVGVSGGQMEVPPEPDVVGWYRFGPGLDAPAGSTVLAGHVDTAERGRGAFFRLRELQPGARLELSGADGQVRAYRVVAREEYRKSAVPLARYFDRDGVARVTLVTCGGPFDAASRHYRDNVVVTASLV
jgi:hypothetical protein